MSGSILMAFTGFSSWAIGDAFIRSLKEYSFFEVAFWGAVTTVLLLSVFSRLLGGFRNTFIQPKLGLRILRGFILAIASFLSILAFMNLPLATAYALIFVVPIMAKVVSVILTKEQIKLRSWLISLLGFAGVLIVVRPGMVPLNIGTVAALGLVLFFSVGQVMARWIGKENQTLLSFSIFQYTLVMVVSGAALFFGQGFTMPPADVALASFIGVLAVSGSLCVAHAYASAPTAFVAPIHYVQIVWGAALGALLFGEYPDIYTMIGGAVIIGAGLWLILNSRNTPIVAIDKLAVSDKKIQ